MASIKKYTNTKGTFYEVQGYAGVDPETGKQVNLHKRGFKTKKAASDWVERERVKIQLNGLPNKPSTNKKPTYTDVYNDWCVAYELQVKESTYLKATRQFKNHILPLFGDKRVDRITTAMCREGLSTWYENLVNFKQVYYYFKKVMNEALEEGYIKKNPCDRVKLPKSKNVVENDEINCWDKEQLNKFLAACKADERDIIYPFFRLLAYSGMRRGEILALTWNNTNLELGHIEVKQALTTTKDGQIITGTPKNEASQRVITLDQETIATLKRWKATQRENLLVMGHNANNKDQLVFSNANNKVINAVRPGKWLDQICEKNKLNRITIHGLRHTHCTLLLEANVNIKEVQRRLGHNDIETTLKIYAHVTSKQQDKAVKEFAQYLSS